MICARDAEATLAEALRSVLAQTLEEWEVLVVDDGSRDSTASVAREFTRRDGRVRLVAGTGGGGPSAARNHALEEAAHELVLFLDADDMLAPEALSVLSVPLGDPAVTATHGGWRRFSDVAGQLEEEHGPASADLFPHLARRPAFALHSCLVRTSAVRAAGGFDEGLLAAEDWDLWQRVARMGARFAVVPGVVCDYRLRKGSQSSDAKRLVRHALEVIATGHSPDARVTSPAPEWAEGLAGESAEPQLAFVAWAAGLLIGRGEDAVSLLEQAPRGAAGLSPEDVGEAIAESAPLAGGRGAAAWPELWAAAEQLVDPFLAALERSSGARRLASRARRHLETAAVRRAGRTAAVGRAHGARIEATAELENLTFPTTAERVVAVVTAEEDPLGTVELPVCDGLVPAEVIADAVADRFWWPLLERFFAATIYRGAVDHDEEGWDVFLQELWGTTGDLYPEPAPLPGRLARLRMVRLAVEVSERLPDPPRGPCDLQLVAAVGGRPIGIVRAADGTAGALRGAITAGCGTELCRAAVREGVIGRPFAAPGNLRTRLAAQAARRQSGDILGLVLGRHAAGPIGTSASRRARLPSAAGHHAAAAAVAAGEPVDGKPGGPVSYAPERVWSLEPERSDGTAAADGAGERRHRFEALFANRPDP